MSDEKKLLTQNCYRYINGCYSASVLTDLIVLEIPNPKKGVTFFDPVEPRDEEGKLCVDVEEYVTVDVATPSLPLPASVA